jgi:hypothetical protein
MITKALIDDTDTAIDQAVTLRDTQLAEWRRQTHSQVDLTPAEERALAELAERVRQAGVTAARQKAEVECRLNRIAAEEHQRQQAEARQGEELTAAEERELRKLAARLDRMERRRQFDAARIECELAATPAQRETKARNQARRRASS